MVSLNIKIKLYLKKINSYLKQEHKKWLILAGLNLDVIFSKNDLKN